MKNISRGKSFLIVTVIYIIAAAVAIALWPILPGALWLKVLIADVIATVITFIFSVIFKNASIYDPYWSVQPIVIVIAIAIGQEITVWRLLPLIAVCLWGVRLTANWAYTFHGLGHQDWRYTMLREQTGVFYPVINFIGIHMVPTLIVWLCTMPVVFTLTSPGTLNAGSVIFFILSLCAMTLQGTADYQMHSFRRSRTGRFIRTGLWKYSRHPNYLGEIMMWWGIALAAVCTLGGPWWLIVGAAANTVLFFSVSIPMADKRQSRKEGFAQYKKETRMLLPIKK
ncbi:MAG: DUF1295 domain-containing protein [Oscillospiraceae bacterium]|nr:DUF1295 domain-containing protein [Oscillospiraceae bacterium]